MFNGHKKAIKAFKAESAETKDADVMSKALEMNPFHFWKITIKSGTARECDDPFRSSHGVEPVD